jgi:hypothetical protein
MPLIGFKRNIYLEWLEQAATLACLGTPAAEARERLDETLQSRIQYDKNRADALSMLFQIWYATSESVPALYASAIELFQSHTSRDDHIALHYGLAMQAYPFFREGAAAIGRALRFGGAVRTSTLQEQLPRDIGNVGSLHNACERITFSLRQWGLLVDGENRYEYVAREPPLAPSSEPLQCWLLAAALTAHPSEALAYDDLVHLPELFPFQIDLTARAARRCPLLQVHRSGAGYDMVLVAEAAR